MRSLIGQLLRVGPHAGAHRVAVRAAVSVAVPLLTLWAADRMDLAIYAAFGAFTSLYARNDVHRSRAFMQIVVGAMLTGAVVIGVAVGISPDRTWLAVPVGALVAGAGSLVSDAQRWHPPGPLFLVFAFAACASIPSSAADLWPALWVAAASAGFSVLVGNVGAWWRVRVRPAAAVRTRPNPTDFRSVALRHVLRSAIGCLLAGAIATGLGIGHPYWAMVSAVVPLVATDVRSQVVRGVHRVVGTFLGLMLAALLLWWGLPTLGLIAVVVVLQGAAELLIGRNYALALIAVTPLALLMVSLASTAEPGVLIRDRAVETVIGVIVGVGVGWLTRRR